MNPDQRRKLNLEGCCRLPCLACYATILCLLSFGLSDRVFSKAHAAPQPAPLTLSSNRFLFVVQASASMQSRAPGVLQAVEKLLMSDMNGNLRQGDTLGLWTFNEE